MDITAFLFREPAYDIPHIHADTDAELFEEYGRQVAKDRLGQLILARVNNEGASEDTFAVAWGPPARRIGGCGNLRMTRTMSKALGNKGVVTVKHTISGCC